MDRLRARNNLSTDATLLALAALLRLLLMRKIFKPFLGADGIFAGCMVRAGLACSSFQTGRLPGSRTIDFC